MTTLLKLEINFFKKRNLRVYCGLTQQCSVLTFGSVLRSHSLGLRKPHGVPGVDLGRPCERQVPAVLLLYPQQFISFKSNYFFSEIVSMTIVVNLRMNFIIKLIKYKN